MDGYDDDKEALRWFRKAAEQGVAAAQFNLGNMYWNGMGVLQDFVYAHMWLNIAAANGAESAGEQRDALAKIMTPAQTEEAQKRARTRAEQQDQGC